MDTSPVPLALALWLTACVEKSRGRQAGRQACGCKMAAKSHRSRLPQPAEQGAGDWLRNGGAGARQARVSCAQAAAIQACSAHHWLALENGVLLLCHRSKEAVLASRGGEGWQAGGSGATEARTAEEACKRARHWQARARASRQQAAQPLACLIRLQQQPCSPPADAPLCTKSR